MKINDPINKSLGLSTEKVESATAKKTDKTKSNPAAVENENVTLSPMASQMQNLESNVASSNVFDADKVEAIKSAISSGQFKVDSGKVADGLIQSVKDLLTNKK